MLAALLPDRGVVKVAGDDAVKFTLTLYPERIVRVGDPDWRDPEVDAAPESGDAGPHGCTDRTDPHAG